MTALSLLLLLGGCYPAYALRAPVSPCTRQCDTIPAAQHADRVSCLEDCPGAEYSDKSCGTDDARDVRCTENFEREGQGEATGLILGTLAGIGLIVLILLTG